MKQSCAYCGVDRMSPAVISDQRCRCGERHSACGRCWRANAVVVGEFPDQDYRLKACPPRKGVVRGS